MLHQEIWIFHIQSLLLDEKNIKINRKILSDISINDNATFQKVVKVAIG